MYIALFRLACSSLLYYFHYISKPRRHGQNLVPRFSGNDVRPGGQTARHRVWTEFFGVQVVSGKIMSWKPGNCLTESDALGQGPNGVWTRPKFFKITAANEFNTLSIPLITYVLYVLGTRYQVWLGTRECYSLVQNQFQSHARFNLHHDFRNHAAASRCPCPNRTTCFFRVIEWA